MRRAAKTDANHKAVVDALRRIGCTVQSLAECGRGVPDLLVGIRGVNFLLEIKDGTLPPSRRLLTDDQVTWHARWRGHVSVVNSVTEALHVVGAITGDQRTDKL